ncbi:hypothetical protein KAR91_26610 [Candidatus Pacearchaeota archaeon]|nr:hypothetical protein [Candidatus Pacearchaeota archaeon]
MANYSTLAMVKRALVATKDTNDIMIQEKMDAAYAHINNYLRNSTTVPISDADVDYAILQEIETLFAAGWYRLEKKEEEDDKQKGNRLIKEADKRLLSFRTQRQEDELLDLKTGFHDYSEDSWVQDLSRSD